MAKEQRAPIVPILITAGVMVLLTAIQLLPKFSGSFSFLDRLEALSYDWRVRLALHNPKPISPNLAAVFIDEATIEYVNEQFGVGFPFPRQLHGRVVRELNAEGAKVIGFDVLFREWIDGDKPYEGPEGTIRSDQFFLGQLAKASNVVLATFGETERGIWEAKPPHELFAAAVGGKVAHAVSETDEDGNLRRARPFKDDPQTGERYWHLGIYLAAQQLGLDFKKTEYQKDRLVLKGTNGISRTIPLDEQGYMFVDWSITWNDSRLLQTTFGGLVELDKIRQTQPGIMKEALAELYPKQLLEETGYMPFTNRLVVIGTIGSGNNITDIGETPLAKQTYLVAKHWNVLNSVLTGQFVRKMSLWPSLFLLLFFVLFSATMTWFLPAAKASFLVLVSAAVYVSLAVYFYFDFRYWIPIVLPVVGGLLLTHVALVSYRVIFEQNERKRVKAVFSKVVSPEIVSELLDREDLLIGGARRRLTVFFADVRGFTEFTDSTQAKAEEFVSANNLPQEEADKYFDEQAKETLATVNLYLSTIADTVKKYNGTLDKFIGDCVMAFWGAPVPNELHALCCVQCAIEAQRAMHAVNQKRFAENKKREQENPARIAAGQQPLPMLPLLTLGTGINTGMVTVGLMGSDAHISNYTVFGREINLASRLEGVSGRGRIIIGEATYQDVLRDDPKLAATCIPQPPVTVKGIKAAVKCYEVPWKEAPVTPAPAPAAPVVAETTPKDVQTT